MTAATGIDQFKERVRTTPAGGSIAALRRASARPEGVVSDPLAAPGGAAGELAERDREIADRRRLKVLLAGNKLHAGLTVAALGHLAREGAPEPPAEAVAAWVGRAGHWIEATVEAQARRRNEAARSGGADPAGPDRALPLSGYHRYELARALVSALQRRPELLADTGPEHMAGYLAAPAPGLPPEPARPGWVSAGAGADRALAWSGALARVAEAAADAPFERPLATVLADARAALAEAAAGRVAELDAAFPVPEDARPIVEQHALHLAGRLYAATLRHVHQTSSRMIGRYRALQAAGNTGAADDLARAYQEGHWGYAGVGHHFRALLAAHLAQQNAALAAMAATAPAERPETAGRARPAGPAA